MKRALSFVLALAMILCMAPAFAESTPAYGEAPILAERVAAGELPPVEERLPVAEDIFVVDDLKNGDPIEIGTYGGTLTKAVAKNKLPNWESAVPLPWSAPSTS